MHFYQVYPEAPCRVILFNKTLLHATSRIRCMQGQNGYAHSGNELDRKMPHSLY